MGEKIDRRGTIKNYDYRKLKVLVVDDYMPMRAILKGTLAAFGINEIVLAADGPGAIDILETFDPDVIFLDNVMRPIGGVELTRRIRAGEVGTQPFVPIIMISGRTNMRDIANARDVGINEFLAKPVSAHLVLMRLQAVVGKPRYYIRSRTFFGPCRRRRILKIEDKCRRNISHEYKEPTRKHERSP